MAKKNSSVVIPKEEVQEDLEEDLDDMDDDRIMEILREGGMAADKKMTNS